jgi:hypothetical protein
MSDELIGTLGAMGLDPEWLCTKRSVWLFGSRAAGCAMPESDWDVLVLDPAARSGRTRIGVIDLVTVGWTNEHPGRWLSSELAVHVSRYGRLVIGERTWTSAVNTRAAAEAKAARTNRRLHALCRAWRNLSVEHRNRRSVEMRRDVQRCLALADRETVPATQVLDLEWNQAGRGARASAVTRFCRVESPLLLDAMLGDS